MRTARLQSYILITEKMEPRIISIFISLCVISLVNAGCPKPSNLPGTDPQKTKFLCARVYELSHWNPDWSCGGRHRDIFNGENNLPLGNDWNDVVNSLVVMPGCWLNAWVHRFGSKFDIRKFTEESNQSYNRRLQDVGWNDKISAWSCNCEFSNKPLTCQPREEEVVIQECQNPSEGNMQCQIRVQTGITIGSSATEGKSLSKTAEFSLLQEFKGIFAAGLSSSKVTTYDWTHTKSSEFKEVTTQVVTCEVLPNKTVKLLQVVGKCGDTVVQTRQFKCANM